MNGYSNLEDMQKVTYIANTVLMLFVLVLMIPYYYFGVTWMVYHSIPTLCFYVVAYYIIKKKMLRLYVWLVYVVLVAYMTMGTICLGYSYGYHLYSMSIIPILFYIEYIGYRIKTGSPRAMLVSIAIIAVDIASAIYVVINGPRYVLDKNVEITFLVINALSVFGFLITYTNLLIKMVVQAQTELTSMAMEDKLTGLYNRHFMITHLEEILEKHMQKETLQEDWLAILDIDDFKKINDQYGHNCGDFVLNYIGEMIRTHCSESTVARWGGEEFLIHGGNKAHLEDLRKAIADQPVAFQNQEIKVTVTIGAAFFDRERAQEYTLDTWVQNADQKLYYGKKHGKNQVVYSMPE